MAPYSYTRLLLLDAVNFYTPNWEKMWELTCYLSFFVFQIVFCTNLELWRRLDAITTSEIEQNLPTTICHILRAFPHDAYIWGSLRSLNAKIMCCVEISFNFAKNTIIKFLKIQKWNLQNFSVLNTTKCWICHIETHKTP